MDENTLNLWRQIYTCRRRLGKKRALAGTIERSSKEKGTGA